MQEIQQRDTRHGPSLTKLKCYNAEEKRFSERSFLMFGENLPHHLRSLELYEKNAENTPFYVQHFKLFP